MTYSQFSSPQLQLYENLQVPSDINPEQSVNFRGVIINKCQTQFETGKSDEQVMKMEKDLAESNDPVSAFKITQLYLSNIAFVLK